MPYPNKATEVQPTANTQTCLPISNYGEYRKAPFNLFSATANGRECLTKTKRLRRKARGPIFFLSTTANREIGPLFFFADGEFEKKMSPSQNKTTANKNDTKRNRMQRKLLRAHNHVLHSAQPVSRRLLRNTTILTQTLRQRNSATAY